MELYRSIFKVSAMPIHSPSETADVESVVVFDPKPNEALKRLHEVLSGRFAGWGNPVIVDSWSAADRADQEAEIHDLIPELESDELARALYLAAVYGDLFIAQSIWKIRGPFTVEYQEGRAGEVVLNGQLANRKMDVLDMFANAKSIAELQALFEWLPTVGMGFMVGVGTQTALLLQSAKLKTPIHRLAWPASFGGDLPVLSASGISRPELFLTLQEKGASSTFPGAYQDVLCWVEQRMFDESPASFDPFVSSQGLKLQRAVSGSGETSVTVPFTEVTPELLADVSQRSIEEGFVHESRATWDYEALDLRTVPLDATNPRNSIVLGYQASNPLRHGFDHLAGHVLCRTTVDVLSQFSIGTVLADNLSKATDFVERYFPVDLLMVQAQQNEPIKRECLRRNGMEFSDVNGGNEILFFYQEFADGSPIQSSLQREVPAALLNYIFGQYCTVDLDAKSMLALHQGLGLDNTGLSLALDYKGLQAMHDAGFRFSDLSQIRKAENKSVGGSYYFHRVNSTDTSVKFDATLRNFSKSVSEQDLSWNNRFANALSMNLWPVMTGKPKSVADALAKASRKKEWSGTPEEQALKAYLDHAGIEACASVAKTTARWVFIKDHFGREAVEPYVREMPRQARGEVLMDDIGL
jgi:hypothetical protein